MTPVLPTQMTVRRRALSGRQGTSPDEVFRTVGLPRGMCLGSKSGYREIFKKHFFVPNAYVFSRLHGLVWWGDLDLWRHSRQLERVARSLGCRLYVVPEYRALWPGGELPFSEVVRRAEWHTGGRVRPSQRLIWRSGLSLSDLELLVGVTRRRLQRPQLPYVALQIDQRLWLLDDFFGPLSQHYGFKKWGDWFQARHPKLGGRSPLEVVRASGTLVARDLFSEIYDSDRLFRRYLGSVVSGWSLLFPSRINLEWPRRCRRE